MTGRLLSGRRLGPTCLQCLFGSTTYKHIRNAAAPADATHCADYVVTVQLAAWARLRQCESSRGLCLKERLAEYAFVVDVRPMRQPITREVRGIRRPRYVFSGPAGLKSQDRICPGCGCHKACHVYIEATRLCAIRPEMPLGLGK